MANTFQNLSFEIVGLRSGEAAAWIQNNLATAEEIAGYGPSSPSVRRRPEDDFEDGWSNDEFVLVLGFTEDAIYDVAVGPERREDFEELWLDNQTFTFVFSGFDTAVYDSTPQDFEDFEEEWLGNEAFETQLGAIASGAFGGPGGVEDFEQSWGVDAFKTVVPIHLNEFPGTTLDWVDSNPDTIVRSAGSWLAEGFVPGWGLEVFSTVSNDGLFLPIIDVTASTITLDITDTAVPELGGPGVVQGVEDALYDIVLRAETFENVWTLMVTF